LVAGLTGGRWRRFQEDDELESLAADSLLPGMPEEEADGALESDGMGSPIIENEDSLLAGSPADSEDTEEGSAY
jgi:hypothetical protein